MHPALAHLVEAHVQLRAAEQALEAAKAHRKQCALDLAEITDDIERREAAVFAYREFGAGLSLALAEAVTGLPGKKGQSAFLVMAGVMTYQPQGRASGETFVPEPVTEWTVDRLERDLVAAHIAHGTPYYLDRGLGWGKVSVELSPAEARDYLRDPTAALATKAGVTRDAFLEWLSTEGHVPCQGVTAKGAPCRSGVTGLSGQLPMQVWKEAMARGGYCHRHGGRPSG